MGEVSLLMGIRIGPDIPKWEVPATTPALRENLFPFRLIDAASGEQLLDPVRVMIGSDRFWVFSDAPQGVVCMLSAQIYALDGDMYDGYAITLVDPDSADPGRTVIAQRSGHCGCGSRLKTFRPFRTNTVNAAI